jgi:hypothetical protein
MSLEHRIARLEHDQAVPHRCRMVMTSRECAEGIMQTYSCAGQEGWCPTPTLHVILKRTPVMEDVPP